MFRFISKISLHLTFALLILGFSSTLSYAEGSNELVVAQSTDVGTFDIHVNNVTAAEAVYVNIFDYLIMRDADGDFQPALATEWHVNDETSWRFTLRDDVTWHDGMPLTAEDVKFTLDRVISDTTIYAHEAFSTIADVEALDEHEVLIRTHAPDPILLNRLSGMGAGIVPKHYVESVGWDGFAEEPMGSGPFKFVEWRRDDRVILEAFDDHWRGRPHWDRLVHRAIPESSTRVGELLTGGVHIATNVPTQDTERIQNSDLADVAPWPTTRIMTFTVNTSEDVATGDPRIREAIEYAIDNQLLIDGLMDGLGVPVRGRLSPGIAAAPMTLYDTYLYDPERATELLAEAGYGPGELTIKIQSPTGRYPNDADIAEFVATMLEAVGINTELEILEWSAYLDRVWNADSIENIGLIGLANPLFDSWFALRAIQCEGSFAGKTNWCNERFDELIQASESELDPASRDALLGEAFEIVADERPQIYLFQLQNLAGVSTDINWEPRPDELLWMYDASPATAE